MPEAVVEAAEKGMVGENLLCGGAGVLEGEEEKNGEGVRTGAKTEVLSRAEEACKTAPRRGAELDGHVRIKGVDV